MSPAAVSSPASPRGVHFVGSLPLPSTRETLTLLSTALPQHITRLPDGEPSTRQNFVFFQHFLLKPHPQLLNSRFNATGTSGAPLEDEAVVRHFLAYLET